MFNDEDAHGRKGFPDAAGTAKCQVFFLADFLVDIQRLKPPFFLLIGREPHVAIRVGWMKSFE